jgi:hypothetical protein
MPAKYSSASEVRRLAQPLIRKHHEHLLRYAVRVEFIFRDDVPSKAGREVWGTARKVSSLNAFLANVDQHDDIDEQNEPFFVIVISSPIWNGLNPEQREALIDHELMHCWAEEDEEGNTKLSIVGHDFEGFQKEIDRHGLWRPDARQMALTMEQHLAAVPMPQTDAYAPGDDEAFDDEFENDDTAQSTLIAAGEAFASGEGSSA